MPGQCDLGRVSIWFNRSATKTVVQLGHSGISLQGQALHTGSTLLWPAICDRVHAPHCLCSKGALAKPLRSVPGYSGRHAMTLEGDSAGVQTCGRRSHGQRMFPVGARRRLEFSICNDQRCCFLRDRLKMQRIRTHMMRSPRI